jgi:hypothetical protein
MIAVQQSVLMKTIVTPEGWQSTIENGVKLISYDGKCYKVLYTVHSIHTMKYMHDKHALLSKDRRAKYIRLWRTYDALHVYELCLRGKSCYQCFALQHCLLMRGHCGTHCLH